MKLILTRPTYALPMLLLGLTPPADAGLWDDPKNLDVLPEDISPAELQATMRAFATAIFAGHLQFLLIEPTPEGL